MSSNLNYFFSRFQPTDHIHISTTIWTVRLGFPRIYPSDGRRIGVPHRQKIQDRMLIIQMKIRQVNLAVQKSKFEKKKSCKQKNYNRILLWWHNCTFSNGFIFHWHYENNLGCASRKGLNWIWPDCLSPRDVLILLCFQWRSTVRCTILWIILLCKPIQWPKYVHRIVWFEHVFWTMLLMLLIISLMFQCLNQNAAITHYLLSFFFRIPMFPHKLSTNQS